MPELNRQTIYSRLSAPLTFRVVLDRRSLEKSKDEIKGLLNKRMENILVGLSEVGIRYLRKMYLSVGRRRLGNLWTNTPLVKTQTGFKIEVYNRAENMEWFTLSNAPTDFTGAARKQYKMKGGGKSLLHILEEGAKPHEIRARRHSNPLQFPIRTGVAQSRSVGSVRSEGGISVGRFARKQIHNDFFHGNLVEHPGVVGSKFVEAATQEIERQLKSGISEMGK